jgi:CDP-glucose 4,6-dehydratase
MVTMNMRNVLKIFSGKRVFVTGHTGFKGSWLVFLLKELGADIMGFALPPETGLSHFELLNLQTKINHVVGDIRDISALNAAIQSFQPEYVFHLAAQALVRKSYDDPCDTFSSNVMGSVHLLDAVRQCNSVRVLVYITSDKCYENKEWEWGYRENDQLGGYDPYSSSKAAAEIVFVAYARSYFASRPNLGAATARAGNVIGGGDWAVDRIVPDCIRAIEKNETIQLRNPNSIRPWQHIMEVISGYLLLAAQLRDHPQKYAGSWNFGPATSEACTVHDLASIISQHFGHDRINIINSQHHHHEITLLKLNCDKAHQLLGWQSRWTLDQTLEATAQWYKTFLDGGDAELITRIQIQNYFPEMKD